MSISIEEILKVYTQYGLDDKEKKNKDETEYFPKLQYEMPNSFVDGPKIISNRSCV